MRTEETPILICGGGSVGLALSNFLSTQGIESLLVERHPRTSHLPKAHYLNQRTMEILREYGMADIIYERGTPMEHMGCVVWLTSLGGDGPLDGQLIHKMDAFGGGATAPAYERHSPTRSGNLPQIRLEPILQDFAEGRGPGTLRFNQEVTDFEQDADGVIATLFDRETEETYQVRAQYMIGADGGRLVGPKLGIETEGPTDLIKMISTHFSADLSQHIDDNDPLIRWLINPEGGGGWGSGAMVAMGPTWFDRRSEEWNIHFAFGMEDENIEDADFAPRIRQLLKLPDLDITINKVSPWIVEAVLAERYREGRIFLAGDAAHRHPPTTGLGLNTGVQDAHNLAWKLAMVLKGEAGATLLDSYEAERRPVAHRNVRWALISFMNHFVTDAGFGLIPGAPDEIQKAAFETLLAEGFEGDLYRQRMQEVLDTQRIEFQAHDIEIGFHYDSSAVIADGTPPPPRAPMGDVHVPTTRPGHRLPHAWLARGEGKVSTLDIGGRGRYVLLIAPAGHAWQLAAREAAEATGVPLEVVIIGASGDYRDPEGRWAKLREIDDDGAILVRPDNHVAWRSASAQPEPTRILVQAFRQALGRTDN